MSELKHSDLTGAIIDAAIHVHRQLGPGLLESAYEACLHHLLLKRGLAVERQKEIPIHFDGQRLESGFRADLIVNQVVLVELKALSAIEPIHEAQILTYLKLSNIQVGLLLNFHSLRMIDGVKRFIM